MKAGKELIGWGKHWEQSRANEVDAGQVWRDKQNRNANKKHKANRK